MQSLRPSAASKTGRGCLLLFGLFWTAFSVFWTIMARKGGGGLMWLFGLPFILIGVGLLASALWRTIAAVRVGPPKISISKAILCPGETFGVIYEQSFRTPVDLYDSKVELVFRESATYTQGTDTRTDTYEQVLESFDGPAGHFAAGQTARQDGSMTIPETGMHTFIAQNNKLQWFVRVNVDVQGWPNMIEEYELTVSPERWL